MKTILHIEPSTFFVEFIKEKFNDSEYEYLCTDSYNEALILLEEFDVDLIISSFEGNGMTCEEFIKEVTYSYQHIPICILSGNKLNANMQQFMNLGVIQYIDKEDVDEALIKYIDNIFKLAKTRPNISFFTFSCIKTVFDVLNKGRDIPEHSIKRIYILKIFDAPKRQIKPPKSNADIAMNFSLLNSLKEIEAKKTQA